jgi:hypothetical protein
MWNIFLTNIFYAWSPCYIVVKWSKVVLQCTYYIISFINSMNVKHFSYKYILCLVTLLYCCKMIKSCCAICCTLNMWSFITKWIAKYRCSKFVINYLEMDLWYFSISEMNVASVLCDYNYKFIKKIHCKLINHMIISNGVDIIILLFFWNIPSNLSNNKSVLNLTLF